MIVDDHLLFRDGLVGLIKNQQDFAIVGEAGTVGEAVAKARELKPDLILMDFSLPDGTGLEATKSILLSHPSCKIIFLTVNDDDETLLQAIRAGAMGFVLKNVSISALMTHIREVLAGQISMSPQMTTRVIQAFAHTEPDKKKHTNALAQLSPREVEILVELASGDTNEQIAARLCLSANTVKHHLSSILSKLELSNRREAAQFVREQGLAIRVKA
jgi:two-component system NarL family response regulator